MPEQVISFEDGVLHLDVPQARMRIQWHPDPKAEEMRPGGKKWRSFYPEFRLIGFHEPEVRGAARPLDIQIEGEKEVQEQKIAAFASFRDELPEEIVRVVSPFRSYQWALMVLMNKDTWATELAVGNPVLAYALANNSFFRRTPPEVAAVQARWRCHRKQRALLEWLGFPATEPMVKLLKKIQLESITPLLLYRMGEAIKTDNRVLGLLSHFPVVTGSVLELATTTKYVDMLSLKLLREVANKPEAPGESSVGDMLLHGLEILNMVAPRRTVGPFTSIRQVVRFQDKMDAEYQAYLQRLAAQREAGEVRQRRRDALAEERRQRLAVRRAAEQDQRRRNAARRGGGQNRRAQRDEVPFEPRAAAKGKNAALRGFPKPPIPGTKDIIPLTSAGQLEVEGNQQQNCVATYAPQVMSGYLYVYKVLHPERATLAICKRASGCWYRSELKAYGNRKVAVATTLKVGRWLAKHKYPG